MELREAACSDMQALFPQRLFPRLLSVGARSARLSFLNCFDAYQADCPLQSRFSTAPFPSLPLVSAGANNDATPTTRTAVQCTRSNHVSVARELLSQSSLVFLLRCVLCPGGRSSERTDETRSDVRTRKRRRRRMQKEGRGQKRMKPSTAASAFVRDEIDA